MGSDVAGTGSKTILIAEDEGEIRELLAMLFEAEGFNVLKASDGLEAIEIVRGRGDEINLLITDLGLPKLPGLELIKQALAHIPALKIIAASGYGHAEVRTELQSVGVNVFFPKPFSPRELFAAARQLLGE